MGWRLRDEAQVDFWGRWILASKRSSGKARELLLVVEAHDESRHLLRRVQLIRQFLRVGISVAVDCEQFRGGVEDLFAASGASVNFCFAGTGGSRIHTLLQY